MRRKDREITDMNEILKIVEKSDILHMALFDDDYPYIVPLHYGYELIDGNLIFFIHSAKEGHKLDLIRINNHVCVELECDIQMISGGNIACKYGSTFSCVIGTGLAEIVDNEDEKILGLKLLMKNQTGQDFDIDAKMAESVEIIKVTVTNFTAKSRK